LLALYQVRSPATPIMSRMPAKLIANCITMSSEAWRGPHWSTETIVRWHRAGFRAYNETRTHLEASSAGKSG
jgi:hypothetical protein